MDEMTGTVKTATLPTAEEALTKANTSMQTTIDSYVNDIAVLINQVSDKGNTTLEYVYPYHTGINVITQVDAILEEAGYHVEAAGPSKNVRTIYWNPAEYATTESDEAVVPDATVEE